MFPRATHPTPVAGTLIAPSPLPPPVPSPTVPNAADRARARSRHLREVFDGESDIHVQIAALRAGVEDALELVPDLHDKAVAGIAQMGVDHTTILRRIGDIEGTVETQHQAVLKQLGEMTGQLETVIGELKTLAKKHKSGRKQIGKLRNEVVALNKEVGKLVSVLKGTATRQTEATLEAYSAHATAEAVSQRLNEHERASQPAMVPPSSRADFTTTVNDKTGALRAEAHAAPTAPTVPPPSHKVAPGLSLPPQRLPAVVGDVEDVASRVTTLERQMVVAGRGDGWTKRQLALFAVVLFVGGYFGRLTWEWVAAHVSVSPAAAVRPVSSGGPTP